MGGSAAHGVEEVGTGKGNATKDQMALSVKQRWAYQAIRTISWMHLRWPRWRSLDGQKILTITGVSVGWDESFDGVGPAKEWEGVDVMQIGTFRRNVVKTLDHKATKTAIASGVQEHGADAVAQGAVALKGHTGQLLQTTAQYLLGLPQTQEMKDDAAHGAGRYRLSIWPRSPGCSRSSCHRPPRSPSSWALVERPSCSWTAWPRICCGRRSRACS